MQHPDLLTCRKPVQSDWARCRAIARDHGRSFYLASRMLPRTRQLGMLATYTYCRIADDIVDRAVEEGSIASATALASWEAQLIEPRDPVAIAFADTRARFAVPLKPVHDLISGIRMDLKPARYATWEELSMYCYHVAGTVGVMVAPILGCREPVALRFAAELGIAMQLTNILRDVAEDAELGRLYLPLDEILAFGCDPEAILARSPGDHFPDLMAFQIERARMLYASAMQGVRSLAPSGRLATLAASTLYEGILDEIEVLEYDVFKLRARVSSARKVGVMARVARTWLTMAVVPQRGADAAVGPNLLAPDIVSPARLGIPVDIQSGRYQSYG